MNTLIIIIIGVALLLILDTFLIRHIRKKRAGSFKLVIEKGIITETKGDIPSEFLYDVQQLARINKPETLIINAEDAHTETPKLEFLGTIDQSLKEKLTHSLHLSLQK